MKISSSNAMRQNHYLNNAQKSQDKALESIAAIRAISGIGSANLVTADPLGSQSSTIDQSVADVYDAVGVLQIVDASSTNIFQGVDKLSGLSVRMNSSIMIDAQKTMLRGEATYLAESTNDSSNNATLNGKNAFQTMEFVVGSGTEITNLNPLNTDGSSIDSQEGTISFTDQFANLRGEIGSGIDALASNINSSVQSSTNTKAAKNNLFNNDMARNVNDFNAAYLKENTAAFAVAQSSIMLQSKIVSLLY